MYFFFFFQAEDGIRVGHVTGVQTCALPISLVVSIVLFLTVSFFTDQIKQSNEYVQSDLNYDIEIASFSSDNVDHAFDDTFINSVISLDGVEEASFIEEFYVETTLDEDQAPKELREIAEQVKYHAGISLYALSEKDLRDYAKEIGVNYSELIEEATV